ncbi:hypothetical protein HZ326_28683 [Fusarium oxysporum f. sp. albedinis]|nr:hypothetical protein HZ326_28683 [Fusarium oxysporum f. sp. albedinis]
MVKLPTQYLQSEIVGNAVVAKSSQQHITPRSDGNSLMPSCQHSVIQRHLCKSSTYTAGNPNASRDQGASRPPDGVTSCHPV